MNWKAFSCVWLAALIGSAGCGGRAKDAPTLARVKGTLVYRGQPLEFGTIVFYPPKGRSGTGKVKDGKIIEVSTLKPNDGAPVGACKVTIQAITNANDMYAVPKSLIPVRYADINRTDLTATIEKGKTNDLKLELRD